MINNNLKNDSPLAQIYQAIVEPCNTSISEADLDRIFANAFWGLNAAQTTALQDRPLIPFHKLQLHTLSDERGEIRTDEEIFEIFRTFFLNFFLELAREERL